MKKEVLKDLIEKTFAVVANPMQSNGIYAEIQKALIQAYDLGNGDRDIQQGGLTPGQLNPTEY